MMKRPARRILGKGCATVADVAGGVEKPPENGTSHRDHHRPVKWRDHGTASKPRRLLQGNGAHETRSNMRLNLGQYRTGLTAFHPQRMFDSGQITCIKGNVDNRAAHGVNATDCRNHADHPAVSSSSDYSSGAAGQAVIRHNTALSGGLEKFPAGTVTNGGSGPYSPLQANEGSPAKEPDP